ncbi:MAG: hypothetical protein MZV65_31335 [Chromatiales bacterium]|nr:hypothetical protein [Chromatiales bacterium]
MVVLGPAASCPTAPRAYPRERVAFAGAPRGRSWCHQAKCETCHEFVVAHGGSRAGDPMMCNVCHNSSVGGTCGSGRLRSARARCASPTTCTRATIEADRRDHLPAEPRLAATGVPHRQARPTRRARDALPISTSTRVGSGPRRQRHPEPELALERRPRGFGDGRHLQGPATTSGRGQGPHGAERRCVRRGAARRWRRRQSDRRLRRLPRPGP